MIKSKCIYKGWKSLTQKTKEGVRCRSSKAEKTRYQNDSKSQKCQAGFISGAASFKDHKQYKGDSQS